MLSTGLVNQVCTIIPSLNVKHFQTNDSNGKVKKHIGAEIKIFGIKWIFKMT
jgi:hypothetical protein